MKYPWLIKPKWLILVPLAAVMLIAVACGDDEATPVPPAAGLSAEEVSSIVEGIVAKQPAGVSAEEVSSIVEGIVAQQPAGVSAAEVGSIVERAVAQQPEGLTAKDVEEIVAMAVATPKPVALTAKHGGVVLATGFRNITGWDPHTAPDIPEIIAISPMYNQLVEYNPVNPSEIIGDLAESWDVSSDGLSYTFTIPAGAKWTDGQDVTADDVVFSINRIIAPGEPRPSTGRIQPYIASAEKTGPLSVVIRLNFPSDAFLRLLATDYMKIVPQHVVEAGVDINIFDNIVGSGPFKAVSFKEGTSWEVEKNTDYFKDGLPYFDGLEVVITTDPGTEIAAFKTGRALMNVSTLNHLDTVDLVKLSEDEDFMSKFDIWWQDAVGGHHLIISSQNPPFDDDRVRRAIFLAVDRQELVDGFGFGKWFMGAPMTPRNSFALPEAELLALPGYRQLVGKKHPDDIAEARRLLAEAGFPGGQGFKATIIAPCVEYLCDAGVVIKQQLEDTLGMELDARGMEAGGWFPLVVAGDYDLSISGYGPTINDPDDRFAAIYLEGGRNWSFWSDPEVTALFNQQQRERDPAKRREINLEMQRLVLNGAPGTVEFIWKSFGSIVSKRIKTEAGHYVVAETVQTIFKHEHEWLEPE